MKNRNQNDGFRLLNTSDLILFDTDGIIADSGKMAVRLLKKILRQRLGEVDLDFHSHEAGGWDNLTGWAMERGLSKKEAGRIEGSIWTNPMVYIESKPIPGALEIINWLDSLGKRLHFYTSRPASFGKVTRDWYDLHVGDLVTKKNLSLRNDEVVGGPKFKAKKANDLAKKNSLLIFEDSPFDAVDIAEAVNRNGGTVILLPYARIKNPGLKKYQGNNLIVIERDSKDQNIWPLFEYLSGQERKNFKTV